MAQVFYPKAFRQLGAKIFGNLPNDSVLSTGIKAIRNPNEKYKVQFYYPRSYKSIMREPLKYNTDNFILNGYRPYQWYQYNEMEANAMLKKDMGLLKPEEKFIYADNKVRKPVNGGLAARYPSEEDVYWDRKARKMHLQGRGPPKKGEKRRSK
ncbi:hypothetical protein WA158_001698 [Blastocystis sp. Blastoise]